MTQRLRELEHTRTELLALRDRLADLDPAACGDADICAAIPAPEPARRR